MTQQSADSTPQIQVTDLIFILQMLQAVANRGAFRLEEFKAVGECYEKLYTYLMAKGAIQPHQNTEINSQKKETL